MNPQDPLQGVGYQYCQEIWPASLDSRDEDGHILRYGFVTDIQMDNHNYINEL
jgi:hypothetical protein